MLSAIKDLGQLIIKEEKKDALDIFVEDPNVTGNYTKVITIEIALDSTGCEFSGVDIENYDSQKMMRYLYRRGSSGGADFSPMAKISASPAGTFERKILGWFRVLENKKISLQEEDRKFLEDLRQVLSENEDEIKEKILNFRKTIPQKERLLLTLKIRQKGQAKYVGDFPLIVDLFFQLIKAKDEELTARQKVCSLCGLKKENILGNINTYAFYTVDKPGFITGNFNESKSWRNFPVCEECKLGLDEGKAYLQKNLTFKFCGIPYNLVPKFIVGYDDISREVVEIFANSSKLVSLREKRIDSITGDEEEILAELAKIDDILTLNFLFIQEDLSAERIRMVIEDVFPSRLRGIFEVKECVDSLYEKNFSFGTLRSFLSKSDKEKRRTDLDKYFLDTADRVFKGNPVNRQFMLKFIMQKIRGDFVRDEYFNFTVRDGLMTLAFLEKMKLFEMEVEQMEKRLFSEMFSKYGSTFEAPLKRGLFLLGSLTEFLLRKQYTELEATPPFRRNLKSLKMNERDFKGLLPKVQNKLEEYDSFDKGKRLTAREAANYLLVSGENWKMSIDEMNFYFAAGMNLVDKVANIVYPAQKTKDKLEKKENGGFKDDNN